jgi:hypothetical protein
MSIAFESEEIQLQKLPERLRQMSDEQLIKFGKIVRGLSEPRVSVTPDPWKAQLEEARAEWRHPTMRMLRALHTTEWRKLFGGQLEVIQ